MKTTFFKKRFGYLLAPLPPFGVLLGSVGYLSSLTPSLIPRDGMMQGVVAALAFVMIYAIFTLSLMVWKWLGFKTFSSQKGARIIYGISALIIIYGLIQGTQWQNSVYVAAGLDTIETIRPLTVIVVSALLISLLIMVGRLFLKMIALISRTGDRFLPKRVSILLSVVFISMLFWSFGSGVLIQAVFKVIDSGSQQLDSLLPVDEIMPSDPNLSGSAESLASWKSLGYQGRQFIGEAPSLEDIQKYSPNQSVKKPIRLYVGMNSANSIPERTKMALAEMLRTDAFSRDIVVIVTPTGKGWVDPGSIAPLEYLSRGDTASIALQYSYLPSWLSLFADYQVGESSAKAMFSEIYDYWKTLPVETRPRLYLNGLSLGSKYSETSWDMWNVIQDPFDGALWSGPTFTNELWLGFNAKKDPKSTYWSPTYQNDQLVRFYTQYGTNAKSENEWGNFRIAYLQYPSDGIAFFDMGSFLKKPKWMNEVKPPDISPKFRYIPVVTFLQLLTDNFLATSLQVGHGHNYAPEDYLRVWKDLIGAHDWDEQSYNMLRDDLIKNSR